MLLLKTFCPYSSAHPPSSIQLPIACAPSKESCNCPSRRRTPAHWAICQNILFTSPPPAAASIQQGQPSPSRVLLTRRTMLITSCHGRFILHGWLRTEKKKVDVPSEKKSFTKFSPLDFRPVIAPVNIVKYCHLLGRNIHILISSFPVQNIFQCTRSTKLTC